MTVPSAPVWVRKRDGRCESFEADKICQTLFAASESQGTPDAFLARELADSVVHFLSEDSEGDIPTTERIAEIVVQVVRELGHSALANLYGEYARIRPRKPSPPVEPPSLATILAGAARQYTLETVYSRDLVAAREAGLLTLTGLETPGEPAGCVLGPPLSITEDLLTDLEQARRFAGRFVVIDGLEDLTTNSISSMLADLETGLRLTGLSAVINLNTLTPPSWADPLAQGPLFSPASDHLSQQRRRRSRELLEPLLQRPLNNTRIDWHLSELDFSDDQHPALLSLIHTARQGRPLAFVFDRPRRVTALAEGLDRTCPAILLEVGIHLPALLTQPGMVADPPRYIQRLGSLVRLALSAALQKRNYLRREERLRPPGRKTGPAVTSGFLLDRARFVLVPIGLDEVVQQFTGWSMATGGDSLESGRQIVRRLVEVLRHDARQAQFDARLDGPASFSLEPGTPLTRENVAGLTPWDASATLRSQLKAGSALHSIAEQGTLNLFTDEVADEEVGEALQYALRNTEIVRVILNSRQ